MLTKTPITDEMMDKNINFQPRSIIIVEIENIVSNEVKKLSIE